MKCVCYSLTIWDRWDKLIENIDDDEEEEEKREWISRYQLIGSQSPLQGYRWEIERKRLEREWAGEEAEQSECLMLPCRMLNILPR